MITVRSMLLSLALSGSALATPFTPIYSGGGEEPDLTVMLNSIYGANGYTRISDAIDEVWIGQTGIAAVGLGTYAAAAQRLAMCSVCDGFDDVLFGETIHVDGVYEHDLTTGPALTTFINAPLFRFFIRSALPDGLSRYYSEASLNSNGNDHMVTYSVNGRPNTFVVAFEDWDFASDPPSDRDYNDLLVEVRFTRPELLSTPEPQSFLMLASALLICSGIARRKAQRP